MAPVLRRGTSVHHPDKRVFPVSGRGPDAGGAVTDAMRILRTEKTGSGLPRVIARDRWLVCLLPAMGRGVRP